MKTIYLEVLERIKAKVTEIKWIDEEWGQLEAYEEPPVLWPCVLIDFNETDFSDLTPPQQIAEAVILFRVAFDVRHLANGAAPAAIREKALSRYDTLHKLHASLHGWAGSNFGRLTRIKQKAERRDDGLKVYQVAYKTTYKEIIDNTTVQPRPTPVIFPATP